MCALLPVTRDIFSDVADFGTGTFDLVFESGDTVLCQPVPIRVDNIIEGNETFSIFITDTSAMIRVDNTGPQDIVIIDSTGICAYDYCMFLDQV